MKTSGIRRRVDELGRIVLPIELRRAYGIDAHGMLEIATEGEAIVLRKCTDGCVFCGAQQELLSYCGKHICAACLRALKEA